MKVTFLPYCRIIEINEDKRLIDIAIENNISIEKDLCLTYMCGRCKVLISKGNDRCYSNSEQKLLTTEERNKGIRLACCVTVKEDMTVILLNNENEIKDSIKRVDIVREKKTEKDKYNRHVNIAIDLGTTTIEAIILDVVNNIIIENIKYENPQRIIGADVISRLSYGYKNDSMMTRLVIESLNRFLRKYENIEKIIIVGNTTMIHFLMSKNIEKLIRAPFQSDYKAGEIVQANKIGLDVKDNVKLILPPLIGAHVGSDAYACIQDVLMDNKKNTMVIDIGTNSEILLNKKGYIMACSTAAGSAFESMMEECGRSCSEGISKNVKPIYDEKNKLIGLDMGIERPLGLCASAIIDLLAILLENDLLDVTGRLKENTLTKKIHFTQEDIRKLQLAKAAISAAVKTILEEQKLYSLGKYDIDKIYLAGAFGENINILNAIRIGLLPKVPIEKYVQIGNSALKGAIKIMKTNKKMVEYEDIKHIELAQNYEFSKKFIENINFNK